MQESRIRNLSSAEREVFSLLVRSGSPMPFSMMRRPLGIDFDFNSKEAEKAGRNPSRYPRKEQAAYDRIRDALTTLVEEHIVICFMSEEGIVKYQIDPIVALMVASASDAESSIS